MSERFKTLEVEFSKMQAQGNDFVVFDCSHLDAQGTLTDAELSLIAKSISDRHYGVGCDQVLVLRAPSSPDVFDFRMDVFNSDGSKAEQCANGLRCVAKYFSDVHPLHTNLSTSSRVVDIETAAGHVTATVSLTSLSLYNSAKVQANLGKPKHIAPDDVSLSVVADDGETATFQGTVVSMGNPHCVIFVPGDLASFPVEKWGPLLERHAEFPDRTNVEFVAVIDANTVKARVWERGAGETLSCGSGACAVAVASITRRKLHRSKILVSLPGGALSLEWSDAGDVLVEGPATTVFRGTIAVQLPVRKE